MNRVRENERGWDALNENHYSPVHETVGEPGLYAFLRQKPRLSFDRKDFWASRSDVDGVFKLSAVAAVLAPQDVVRLKESDTDQFFDQSVPFALQTGFVGFREGFLEHGEGPPFSKRERRITFFQVPCHLGTQRFQLIFCSGFSRRRQSSDAVNVRRIRTTDVFDKARGTGGVERFDGVYTAFFYDPSKAHVVFSAGIGRDGNTRVQFPWFQLMAAQVANWLKAPSREG